MTKPVLLWFKRDLRITDHPALARAASLGPVIPLYVIEPAYWRLPDTSARQWAFFEDSLHALRGDLARLGMPLIVRQGDAVEQLEVLRAEHCFEKVISHEETGNAWTYARDIRVAAWARERSVHWQEIQQCGVVRRLANRDTWAAARNRHIAQPTIETPSALAPVAIDPGPIVPPQMQPDPCPQRQIGGREQALQLLGGFLTQRGESYQSAMSSPLLGEWACSRLSPHLAAGTLSVREAAHAGAARTSEVKGTRTTWPKAMRSFEARLAWRDHFMQKLEDEPRIETHCLHRAYEGMRPRESDAARLHAWEMGETGLPFVDACMRFTRATGWLNFRMRSMVTAVAAYHLWLDWRSFGPTLARYFTDYEPGIHWSQLQMQSGVTGINTVRIYNPIKQGLDQDPTGAFTRRWCPELAHVPDAHLQTPWTWEGTGQLLGRAYPAPIVDVAASARAAKEAVFAVRREAGFRDEARGIVTKHASRKGQRHFRRDPDRKAAPKRPDSQMSFDF